MNLNSGLRLSNKQKMELDAIRYFIPDWCTFEPTTDKDIETFFAWSDRGIPYKLDNHLSGLAALHYGKQYRDLHITMYKEDIREGYIPKWELIEELPAWFQTALKGVGPNDGVMDMWRAL